MDNVPATTQTFRCYHCIATGRYAWFNQDDRRVSEWYPAQAAAQAWDSIAYRKRAARVEQLAWAMQGRDADEQLERFAQIKEA
jgi:hypothetical protein